MPERFTNPNSFRSFFSSTHLKTFKPIAVCILIWFIGHAASAQQVVSQTFNSNGTFNVPAGVTKVTVQAWGAGGGGGGADSNDTQNRAGGGGAGGSFTQLTVTVVPGAAIPVVVGTGGAGGDNPDPGAAGGQSSFNGAAVVAAGGAGGVSGLPADNSGAGGAAGSTAGPTFGGGAGADAPGGTQSTGSGGGGAAAGTSNAGASASGSTAGVGTNGGGSGGPGLSGLTAGTSANGNPGVAPGGGGGGAWDNLDDEDKTGGSGANGRVTVTYTLPTAAITYDDADGRVRNGQVLRITATFSEAIQDAPPAMQITLSGVYALALTDMVKTDATHYYYDHTVGAGDGAETVALGNGVSANGNIVHPTPTSGAIFTVDNIAPTASKPTAGAQILKSGAVSTSTAQTNENGVIYFVLNGQPAASIAQVLAAVGANNGFVAQASATAGSPYTITVPAGIADGVYDIIAADQAGNVSAIVPGWLTVDNTAPTVVLTDDHADGVVRDADAVIITATFVEANGLNGTPTIQIGTALGATAMTGGPLVWTYSWNVPGGNNANHPITISAVDAAGNANTAATAGAGGQTSYTIDNIAPTVVLTDDHADGIVRDADQVIITATFTEANALSAAPTIQIGTALATTAMTGGPLVWTYTWDVPAANDGSHAITITSTDVAGNPSAAPTAGAGGVLSYTIDNSIPTISTLTSDASPASTLIIGGTITFTATMSTAEAGLTFSPSVGAYNGGDLVWSTSNGGSTYTATYTVLAGQTDQLAPIQLLNVSAVDAAGNTTNTISTVDVLKTIDANAPASPAATVASEGGTEVANFYNLSNTSIDFSVPIPTDGIDNSLDGGSVQILVDNQANGGFIVLGAASPIMVVDQGTTKLVSIPHATLSINGKYAQGNVLKFRVTVTDAFGNSTTTATLGTQITIDRVVPTTPTTLNLTTATDSRGGATGSAGTSTDNITNSTNPTIDGNGENGSNVTITSSLSGTLSSGTVSTGTFTIALGAISEGTHTLTAQATDAAGNVSGVSTGLNVTIDRTAPTRTGVEFFDNGSSRETVVISFSETIDLANAAQPVIGSPGFTSSTNSVRNSATTAYSTGTNRITLESNNNA